MAKYIAIALILLGGGFAMSHFLVGYPRAGNDYISKHREMRKSIRHGSGFIAGGPRGFRGGK